MSLVCTKIIAQVQTHLKIKLLILTIAIGQATDTLQTLRIKVLIEIAHTNHSGQLNVNKKV